MDNLQKDSLNITPFKPTASWKPIELAYSDIDPYPDADNTLSPVILLHGFFFTRLTWNNIPRDIANMTKRKVYVLDARNHGESEWTDEFNHDIMVKDLEHFMDKKEIPRAIILGHSLGGTTGMLFAMRQPEKVEKLIVEDRPPKSCPLDLIETFAEYTKLKRHSLNLVEKNTDLDHAKKIIAHFLISNFPLECHKTKMEEHFCSTLPLRRLEDGRFAWQANIDVLEDAVINKQFFGQELEGVYKGDVLFVYGTQSSFKVYEQKDNTLKMFPKAKFFPVFGASHFVHVEFPVEYLKAILDFI